MALSLARGGGLVEGEITAQKWITALDEAGMEGSVLYATSGLAIGLVRDLDWSVALARGYNNWLSECLLKPCPRLKGMAVLPMQSPPDAAEELRRAVAPLLLGIPVERLAAGRHDLYLALQGGDADATWTAENDLAATAHEVTHEALSAMPVQDPASNDAVCQVIRHGYTIGDEVLRPASVVVGRAGS